MKSPAVPRCRIECRTRELMSYVRAELAYQRAAPKPPVSLAAANATLSQPPLG